MSINLVDIAARRVPYKEAISKLEALGNATEGPLRVTVEDGIPYLGVRTWTQFFKEHCFGDDLDILPREKRTAKIVEYYIPLIRAACTTNGASDKIHAKNVRMQTAIYRLRAKVAGVELNPKLGRLVNVVGATTMPTYKNAETRCGTVESFHGKFSVPPGLSMGTVPISKVIAERRFGRSLVGSQNFKYGKSEPIDIDSGLTEYSENEYYAFYKNHLADVSDDEKSVAIELYVCPGFGLSDANRNGAWRAASEFVATRKTKNKPASVLLCLNKMPEVTSNRLKVPNPQNTCVTKVVASTNVSKKQITARQTDNVMVPDGDNDDESEN